MSDEKPTIDFFLTRQAKSRDAALIPFVTAFGKVLGTRYFGEGLTMLEARRKYVADLACERKKHVVKIRRAQSRKETQPATCSQ